MKMGLAEPSSRNPDGSRRPPEGENVGVFARLRPEAAGTKKGELTVKNRFGEQRTCTVRNLEFSLDWVFDEDAAQEDVYEVAARERVAGVLDGYNATLLAYGQTGSGKTHTMYGPPEVLASFEGAAYDDYGLVPRACEQIFEAIDAADVEAGYIVQCSYLEVYNDRINDLLAGRKNLAVRERSRGVVVDGLHFEAVDGLASTMAVLQAGDANRVVAAMKMNPRSSRGHALFALHVSDTRPDAEAEGGAPRNSNSAQILLTQFSDAPPLPRRRQAHARRSRGDGECQEVVRRRRPIEPAGAPRGGEEHQHEPLRAGDGDRAAGERRRRPRAVAQLEAHAAAPGLARRQLAVRDRDHLTRRGEEHR